MKKSYLILISCFFFLLMIGCNSYKPHEVRCKTGYRVIFDKSRKHINVPDILEGNNIVEPVVDLAKVKNNVIYPEKLKKARKQCVVVVRYLIDSDCKIIRAFVEFSENEQFNDFAIAAIKKTAYAESPAYKDGVAVPCWVSMPIKFNLK